MTQIDRNSGKAAAPLSGSGGVSVTVDSEREPYEALDDLMCVVEAFCPVWPERGIFPGRGIFLL